MRTIDYSSAAEIFHEEGVRNIGRYGDEYGDEEDLAVLFHGAGHYEALRVL